MISTVKKCCRLLLLMPLAFDLALAIGNEDAHYDWFLKFLVFVGFLVVMVCIALCRLNEEEMDDLMRNDGRNDSIDSDYRNEGLYDLQAVTGSTPNLGDNSIRSYRNALWSSENQLNETEHRADATSLSNKSTMDDEPPSYESVMKENPEFNENQQKFGKNVQRF